MRLFLLFAPLVFTIPLDRYEGVFMFPPPPPSKRSGPTNNRDERTVEERDTRLRPVDVHFLKEGKQLVASYLAHGIV